MESHIYCSPNKYCLPYRTDTLYLMVTTDQTLKDPLVYGEEQLIWNYFSTLHICHAPWGWFLNIDFQFNKRQAKHGL